MKQNVAALLVFNWLSNFQLQSRNDQKKISDQKALAEQVLNFNEQWLVITSIIFIYIRYFFIYPSNIDNGE